jgi:hypothetical protein
VLRDFWLPELETFAPALVLDGPTPTPVRVVASSPGHLLASRLLDGPEAAPYREALRWRLAAPDLLAGAGLRTKATGSPRFQPGAYHNGSVWPMDTGLIGDGLRRHGYAAQADNLEERTLRACAAVGGLPEFFRGDPDGSIRVNTHLVDVSTDGAMRRVEQPPQWTQGWTASRVWKLLRRHGLVPRTLVPGGAASEDDPSGGARARLIGQELDIAPERRTQGSGLGLPIARAMAELPGGSLWLESRPGAGSTFWLALPAGRKRRRATE